MTKPYGWEKEGEEIPGPTFLCMYILPAFSQELYFLNMWLLKKSLSFFLPFLPGRRLDTDSAGVLRGQLQKELFYL